MMLKAYSRDVQGVFESSLYSSTGQIEKLLCLSIGKLSLFFSFLTFQKEKEPTLGVNQ